MCPEILNDVRSFKNTYYTKRPVYLWVQMPLLCSLMSSHKDDTVISTFYIAMYRATYNPFRFEDVINNIYDNIIIHPLMSASNSESMVQDDLAGPSL